VYDSTYLLETRLHGSLRNSADTPASLSCDPLRIPPSLTSQKSSWYLLTNLRVFTKRKPPVFGHTSGGRYQSVIGAKTRQPEQLDIYHGVGQESEKGAMQPYEEVSLLIESVEDDLARAVRSGNVALARQFARELRARFSVYRDACADAGIAWAIRSQRAEQRERGRTGGEFKHAHQERRHT
jgi:hypothetical protein